MKYFFALLCFTVNVLAAQPGIENLSSGTSGDAILTIESDTDNNNEGDNARINLIQDGGSLGAFIGFNNSWGGSSPMPDNLFRIGTRWSNIDNYNRIVINGENGNVGIGSDNPISKLHVTSSTSGDTRLRLDSDTDNNNESDNSWIEIMQDGGSLGAYIGFNSDWGGSFSMPDNLFRIGTRWSNIDNYDRLVINGQNGNVGIGTSNPSQLLHIQAPSGDNQMAKILVKGTGQNHSGSASNIGLSGSLISGTADDASFGRYNVGIESWYGIGFRSSINGKEGIIFNTRTASAFFEGNVGIGTDQPDSKLTVAGNIHAREVKVTVDAGADFVFDSTYELRTLEEIKDFIDEKKHLPEISSEEEMLNNGLKVGEMNIKLLQKIEELTLYLIEQNERLKSQSEKNQTLVSRIDQLEYKLSQLENK